MRNRRGAIFPGLVLIALGLWFLADALGWQLPSLGDLWPIFPLGFGLASLVNYFTGGRQNHGLVFSGVSSALIGALFFAITLGPLEWGDLGRLWPLFILISGLAFTVQWLVQPSERGLLDMVTSIANGVLTPACARSAFALATSRGAIGISLAK